MVAFPFGRFSTIFLLLDLYHRHCERSEAIHLFIEAKLDCFVASLLAMTFRRRHFFPASSLAFWPNMFLRASSSNGSFTNLPIASPACTCGRARTCAYQRLTSR